MGVEPVNSQLVESDLHRLDLRFAPLRIQQAKAVEALARSIERSGQLTPVVAVAESEHCWVLVDGYLRIAALRRAGRDTAWVERWDCALHQALLWVLARVQARPWQAIEEACVVRELVMSYDQSQREVARQIGRDVSWVNRRLALVDGLPEELLNAVAQGRVSTSAATRILAPLARANSAHAHHLLQALLREPVPMRELQGWYRHYHRANRERREQMVNQPSLFLKALRARKEDATAKRLREGPEGAWLADLKRIGQILRGLRKQVPLLFAGVRETGALHQAFVDMKAVFRDLEQELARYTKHDPPRDSRGDCGSASQGHVGAQDKPLAQDLAQHGAPGVAPPATQGPRPEGSPCPPPGTD